MAWQQMVDDVKENVTLNQTVNGFKPRSHDFFFCILFYFIFFTGITRTYREIRKGITVLTQITLITNYREATLYYKK